MSYTYNVWLYGIAMIICTNTWGQAKLTPEEQEWLDKNSILIEVGSVMYEEDPLPIRMD